MKKSILIIMLAIATTLTACNTSTNNLKFSYDLSRIETDDTKQLIIDLYNEHGYNSYELIDVYYNNMNGTEFVNYVILLDNDYWVLSSDFKTTEAVKDEFGIFDNGIIVETETPYR